MRKRPEPERIVKATPIWSRPRTVDIACPECNAHTLTLRELWAAHPDGLEFVGGETTCMICTYQRRVPA